MNKGFHFTINVKLKELFIITKSLTNKKNI